MFKNGIEMSESTVNIRKVISDNITDDDVDHSYEHYYLESLKNGDKR